MPGNPQAVITLFGKHRFNFQFLKKGQFLASRTGMWHVDCSELP